MSGCIYKLWMSCLTTRDLTRCWTTLRQRVRHKHTSVSPALKELLINTASGPVQSKQKSREHAASVKLSKLSREEQLLLRRLKFEYEIEKAEGNLPLPRNVPNWYWLQLLREQSFEGRMQLYEELYDMEQEQEERLQNQVNEYQKYDNMINTLNTTGTLLDTYIYAGIDEVKDSRRTFKLDNSLRAWRFGRPVVFEFSPNPRYLTQILHCLQLNQDHISPVAFHITNMNFKNRFKEMENISLQNPFIEYHTERTQYCFEKERLVYICDSDQSSINIQETGDDILVFTEHHSDKNHDFGGARTASIPFSRYVKFYDFRDNYIQYMLSYKFGSLLDFYLSENWTQSLINNLPAGIEAYTVDELLDYIQKQKVAKLIKYGR